VDLGVLKELGKAFVDPDGNPRLVVAELKVGVLVVDGGVRVLFVFEVEIEQDVVLVGRTLEEAGEFQLAASQVFGRLEGLKGLCLRRGNDDDGLGRIDVGPGKRV
jgi:hypothetical protein